MTLQKCQAYLELLIYFVNIFVSYIYPNFANFRIVAPIGKSEKRANNVSVSGPVDGKAVAVEVPSTCVWLLIVRLFVFVIVGLLSLVTVITIGVGAGVCVGVAV